MRAEQDKPGFTSQVEHRLSWRKDMEKNNFDKPVLLHIYEENRENPNWAMATDIQHLCEYILFLQSKFK